MRTVDPERHARRRDEILDAAAEAFARKGFDATTVLDIRAAAGVGAGTLFHYFDDKAAILRAIVDRDAERQRDALAIIAAAERSGTAGAHDPGGTSGRSDADHAAATLWSVVDLIVADLAEPTAAGMVACLLNRMMVDEAIAASLVAADAAVGAVLRDAIARLDTDIAPDVGATWIIQIVDGLYLRCGDPDFRQAPEIATLRLVIARFLGIPTPGIADH